MKPPLQVALWRGAWWVEDWAGHWRAVEGPYRHRSSAVRRMRQIQGRAR